MLKIIGGHTSYRGKITYLGRRLSRCDARKNFSSSLVYRYLLSIHAEKTVVDIIKLIETIDKCGDDVSALLVKAGLNDKKSELVEHLSAGEIKRLVTVLTLYRKASVYLLDEPLTSLDKENQVLIKRLLKEKSETALIIYTSHDDLKMNDNEKVIDLNCGVFDELKCGDTKSRPVNLKFSLKVSNKYLKENGNSLSTLKIAAFVIAFLLGGIIGYSTPEIVDYALPPDSVSRAIDPDYGYLDFSDSFNTPKIKSVVDDLESAGQSLKLSGTIKSLVYNDLSIGIEEIYPLESDFYPLVLSEELFNVAVPSDSFYMTTALEKKVSQSKIFARYGLVKDPLGSLRLAGLKYAGTVNSPQTAFIVKDLNVAACLKVSGLTNEEVVGNVIYDSEGQPLGRPLKHDEAAIYYDPSAGSQFIPATFQIFGTEYNIVGYTTDQWAKNSRILSSAIDIFELYCQKSNEQYPSHANLIPLVSMAEKDYSPFEEFTKSLGQQVVRNYRLKQKDNFVINVSLMSVTVFTALSYLAFYMIYLQNRNKNYLNLLGILGYESSLLLAVKNFLLLLPFIFAGTFLFLYRFLEPLYTSNKFHSLLLLAPLILILFIQTVIVSNRTTYPLEKSQDIDYE